jgi:hypothetical protein
MFPGPLFGGWITVPFIGIAIAGWGFVCLLYLIPRTQGNPNVRTDIFSVKASYWAIIVGLVCTSAWLLSAVIIRSLVILRVTQNLH